MLSRHRRGSCTAVRHKRLYLHPLPPPGGLRVEEEKKGAAAVDGGGHYHLRLRQTQMRTLAMAVACRGAWDGALGGGGGPRGCLPCGTVTNQRSVGQLYSHRLKRRWAVRQGSFSPSSSSSFPATRGEISESCPSPTSPPLPTLPQQGIDLCDLGGLGEEGCVIYSVGRRVREGDFSFEREMLRCARLALKICLIDSLVRGLWLTGGWVWGAVRPAGCGWILGCDRNF